MYEHRDERDATQQPVEVNGVGMTLSKQRTPRGVPESRQQDNAHDTVIEVARGLCNPQSPMWRIVVGRNEMVDQEDNEPNEKTANEEYLAP
jgi:hypothetical protein